MDNTTPHQAKETYLKTVRDVVRNDWPNWVLVIHNSLVSRSWIGRNNFDEWVRKAYYLLIDLKVAKPTAIELIELERVEQQTKHGRSVARDVEENEDNQLVFAAHRLVLIRAVLQDGGQIMSETPVGWSVEAWQHMCRKPYKERLVIAAALLAAEVDRLDAIQNQ